MERAERALLYSLGFNLEVAHPPQLAIEFLQSGFNTFLPEDTRVGPAEWKQQVHKRVGEAYEVIKQLQNITWSLGMLRCGCRSFWGSPSTPLIINRSRSMSYLIFRGLPAAALGHVYCSPIEGSGCSQSYETVPEEFLLTV